jgi:hypothetical protein
MILPCTQPKKGLQTKKKINYANGKSIYNEFKIGKRVFHSGFYRFTDGEIQMIRRKNRTMINESYFFLCLKGAQNWPYEYLYEE